MTPLQKAAQELIDAIFQTDYTFRLSEQRDALERELEAEQAQAVELVECAAIKNILDEYGLQAIDFVANFKQALEAKQVAVPMTNEQMEDVRIELCDSHTISRPAMAATVRAVEAHHNIGVKPDHTDWSAA